MRATNFLWRAAGCPMPSETDGAPLDGRPLPEPTHCASCGEPASYRLSDAISDNFTTVRNDGRAWGFGGSSICQACMWCCRSLALRCAPFFATERGFYFLGTRPLPGLPGTRPDYLSALLSPPEPPFVACFPRFGVDAGGESNIERTLLSYDGIDQTAWPRIRQVAWLAIAELLATAPATVKPEQQRRAASLAVVNLTPPWPSRVDWAELRREFEPYRAKPWWRACAWPLIKLQSKHCALYARIATSSERYPLQVDDAADFMVDVPIWRALRPVAEALSADLRRARCSIADTEAALISLAPPIGCRDARLLSGWTARVAPLRVHARSIWWSTFVSLLSPKEVS